MGGERFVATTEGKEHYTPRVAGRKEGTRRTSSGKEKGGTLSLPPQDQNLKEGDDASQEKKSCGNMAHIPRRKGRREVRKEKPHTLNMV